MPSTTCNTAKSILSIAQLQTWLALKLVKQCLGIQALIELLAAHAADLEHCISALKNTSSQLATDMLCAQQRQQIALQLKQADAKLKAEATYIYEWQQTPEHHLLSWDHPSFPAFLWQIHSPPLLLYLAGNIECLDQPQIALIGSRKPTPYARELTQQLAYELALAGFTIDSGLAQGIDSAAHLGALQATQRSCNHPTLAVLGHGLAHPTYPKQNAKLALQIIAAGGALVSEYPLYAPPLKHHFPARNRIISGLSLGTIVAEAGLKSGSLITARMALEQNRELMVIPTTPGNPQTAGGLHLLKQGAHPISCSTDVLQLITTQSWPEWLKRPNKCLTATSSSKLSNPKQTSSWQLSSKPKPHKHTALAKPTSQKHTVQAMPKQQRLKAQHMDHKAAIPSTSDGLDTTTSTSDALAATTSTPDGLDAQSKHLLTCFDSGLCTPGILQTRSGLTATEFHVSLQRLQLAGLVKSQAGGYLTNHHAIISTPLAKDSGATCSLAD